MVNGKRYLAFFVDSIAVFFGIVLNRFGNSRAELLNDGSWFLFRSLESHHFNRPVADSVRWSMDFSLSNSINATEVLLISHGDKVPIGIWRHSIILSTIWMENCTFWMMFMLSGVKFLFKTKNICQFLRLYYGVAPVPTQYFLHRYTLLQDHLNDSIRRCVEHDFVPFYDRME